MVNTCIEANAGVSRVYRTGRAAVRSKTGVAVSSATRVDTICTHMPLHCYKSDRQNNMVSIYYTTRIYYRGTRNVSVVVNRVCALSRVAVGLGPSPVSE